MADSEIDSDNEPVVLSFSTFSNPSLKGNITLRYTTVGDWKEMDSNTQNQILQKALNSVVDIYPENVD